MSKFKKKKKPATDYIVSKYIMKKKDNSEVEVVEKVPLATYLVHGSELKASKALKTIPRYKIFKKVGNITESFIQIDRLSNCIKLGKDQLPEIYEILVKICGYFKIEVPNLFLEMDVNPKSNVMGVEQPNVVLTSGLIELLNMEELETELAHCVGHIICNHYYYQTIADAIMSIGLGPIGAILYYPFSYWKNCIEFSADRVAAVYHQSAEPVKKLLLKYAGVTDKIRESIDVDLIIKQAETIAQKAKGSEAFAKLSGKSPVLRIYELEKWFGGSVYQDVVEFFENKVMRPKYLDMI